MAHLPQFIEPRSLAQKQSSLNGSIAIADLAGIQDVIADNQGQLDLELHFSLDEKRRPCISGKLNGTLKLTCQRCLETIDFPLAIEFRLIGVTSDLEAKQLSESFDPLILTDQQIKLAELLQQEILLNLPIIPKHEEKDCKFSLKTLDRNSTYDTIAGSENPFQKISKLKRPKKTSKGD